MSEPAPIDQRKLASAKLNCLLAVGLDAKLSKLAGRAANVLVGKHMHSDHGGVAWAAIATYCADLGIKSDSAMRAALLELERGEYLKAEKVSGKTTRYSIADRFFKDDGPPPQREAG